MKKISPSSCPRFLTCRANVCPLDEGWKEKSHAKGEPVCGLMRLSMDEDISKIPVEILPRVLEVRDQILRPTHNPVAEAPGAHVLSHKLIAATLLSRNKEKDRAQTMSSLWRK